MPSDHRYRISQVAVVVKDLDEAMKSYHDLLGWGPWNVYEHQPPGLHHTHLHGKPQHFTMIAAECEIQPGLIFELIQPLEGPSIYKEHLEKYGEGVQHIAMMMHSPEESEALKKRFKDEGAEVVMGGRTGETLEFYYIDTMPQLKFVLESGIGHAIALEPVRQYPPRE